MLMRKQNDKRGMAHFMIAHRALYPEFFDCLAEFDEMAYDQVVLPYEGQWRKHGDQRHCNQLIAALGTTKPKRPTYDTLAYQREYQRQKRLGITLRVADWRTLEARRKEAIMASKKLIIPQLDHKLLEAAGILAHHHSCLRQADVTYLFNWPDYPVRALDVITHWLNTHCGEASYFDNGYVASVGGRFAANQLKSFTQMKKEHK